MSGGHFDYNQYVVRDIADQLERDILRNNEDYRRYTKATINEMITTLCALRVCESCLERIDYLLSGDDSEATFRDRLSQDMLSVLDRLEQANINFKEIVATAPEEIEYD